MRLRLRDAGGDGAVELLSAHIPKLPEGGVLRYDSRAGALARLDGRVVGAFDREHRELVLDAAPTERGLTLEAERRGLPTHGLPPGPGWRWWLMNRRASTPPAQTAAFDAPAPPPIDGQPHADGLPLWGHSHLDVAWLWSFEETHRKAMRTFANAVVSAELDPTFVFVQGQPQLYAFVKASDPEFYERVRRLTRAGRFDASVAAMWVESDCNLPSGESLLRQLLYGHRFCVEEFGIEPSIAWLPDSFGFARTLPTLFAHAGIGFFGTTKLGWNDTVPFPYRQFRWRGPDGAEVIAANIGALDRTLAPLWRWRARMREEPLIVGYGDGGGGPSVRQVREARDVGRWERATDWYQRLTQRAGELPVHDDELYLQYHRGVYTTHRDVKQTNAALERRLSLAEERAAWCVAVGAPRAAIARICAELRDAWTIVLRNQFHDVLPGTAIAPVYGDAMRDYGVAFAAVDRALASAAAMLPRPARDPSPAETIGPRLCDGSYVLDNGVVSATIGADGTISALSPRGGESVIGRAGVLTLYGDRPRRWEAWNLDASYRRTGRVQRPREVEVEDRALVCRFLAGAASPATLRVRLIAGEAFLRCDLAIDWRERRKILRVENDLSARAACVTYGAPHGTIARRTLADTPQLRAQYEVPGQRFAFVRDEASGAGMALLALDTYGWSGRSDGDRVSLGHSLLRATTWPDPHADEGRHDIAWAYAPLARDATIGSLERLWCTFACEPSVRLFDAADDGLQVAACKPAEDGDGVVVRVRECDGIARELRVRCAGRMRSASRVDGLERAIAGDVGIDGEWLSAPIAGFGLAAFRVRF